MSLIDLSGNLLFVAFIAYLVATLLFVVQLSKVMLLVKILANGASLPLWLLLLVSYHSLAILLRVGFIQDMRQ